MRVLLIAPNQSGIDSIPEIRNISELHRTFVLNGHVTCKDVYAAAKSGNFDAIHFATHLVNEDNRLKTLALSASEVLTLDDVVQVVKLAKASLVFFNLCLAARFGSYISRRTNASCVYTTIELEDAEAWKLPLGFYEETAKQEILAKTQVVFNYKDVFDSVDDESGIYGWSPANHYYDFMLEPLKQQIIHLEKSVGEIKIMLDLYGDKLGTASPRPQSIISVWMWYVLWIVVILSSIITIWGSFFNG